LPTGEFVQVADVVATARDEHGLPILKNIVHIAIAVACESGRVTAVGRPCDENGVHGAPVVILVEHWPWMAFPIASRKYPHATFWHGIPGQIPSRIAYTDIMINVDEWLSYQSDQAAQHARLVRLLTTNRRARRRTRASPKANRIIHWLESLGQIALRGAPHALAVSWLQDNGRYGGLAPGGKTRGSKSYTIEIITNWQTRRT
jgi:hypothetical protein